MYGTWVNILSMGTVGRTSGTLTYVNLIDFPGLGSRLTQKDVSPVTLPCSHPQFTG